MCSPTMAMVGLNAIGTFARINDQNEAAQRNAMNAKLAANNEYVQNTQKYLEDSRAIIQAGFDRVLEGREAESLAYTSAIENGVQGASIRALMRDKNFKMTRNRIKTEQELESLKSGTEQRMTHINDKTKARIASVPNTSFGLGDAVSILTPIVKKEMG